MNCPYCGVPLTGEELFCPSCGSNVEHVTKNARLQNQQSVQPHGKGETTAIMTSTSPSPLAPEYPIPPSRPAYSIADQLPLEQKQPSQKRRLVRTRRRWIAGVIGGIANFLNISPGVLRFAFLFVLIFLIISESVAYLVLFIALYLAGAVLIPEEKSTLIPPNSRR